jgi:hypothetical protein
MVLCLLVCIGVFPSGMHQVICIVCVIDIGKEILLSDWLSGGREV